MDTPARTSSACALIVVAIATTLAAAPPPAAASEEWNWPVRGRVITPYRNDNARPYAGGMHRGIDIAAAVGEPVVAARAGRVSFAGSLGSSGLTVSVETVDGRYDTSYLHLSELAVKRGATLAAGARVGSVGTTGSRSAAEPHLHFGVRLAGRDFYLDPLTVLPALAVERPSPPAPPVAAPLPARMQPATTSPRPAPGGVSPQPLRSPGRAPAWAPGGVPAGLRVPAKARGPLPGVPHGRVVHGVGGVPAGPSSEPAARGMPAASARSAASPARGGASRAPQRHASPGPTPAGAGRGGDARERPALNRAPTTTAPVAGAGFDTGRAIAVAGLVLVAAAILVPRRFGRRVRSALKARLSTGAAARSASV